MRSAVTGAEDLPKMDVWAGLAHASLDRFPGPALLIASDGRQVEANVHADVLSDALADRQSSLAALVERCKTSGAPTLQKLTINSKSGTRQFDIQALPVTLPDQLGVLLFGREVTLEHNLTNALVESRQMFKDLLTCSADFAWETDAQGIFRYVSPRGAFGYPAHELTGRPARSYLSEPDATRSPFSTQSRIESTTITIRRNDGGRATVHLAATPILNQKGDWLGARGICRDMTMSQYQDTAYIRLQARHQLITDLTALTRDLAENERILSTSAAVIASAMAANCWLLRREDNHLVADGDIGNSQIESLIESLTRDLGNDRLRRQSPIIEDLDGQPVVIAMTRLHGQINGALIVLRAPEHTFDDHDLTLLDEAAELLSLTIAQVENQTVIERLTTLDSLTGLLNQRSFLDFVATRITHQRRTGALSSLLLLEIDHFETLQDRHSPLTGDSVLRQIGDMLQQRSRAGDAIARLGGCRFALWLEDTATEGAVHKARHIIRSCEDITAGRVTGLSPVSVSVGIVGAEPRPGTSLNGLMEAAEAALRHATRKGPGNFALGAVIPADY
ncbi:sensor domain-containing diguanylate cyclase [Govanella unica]|uniref:Sensor domain-containing diguanylate cyclase n=1 Tax=Govanella unica TaxID=2975056 RepID=A0A9X3Z6D1_9PROT|nr:sensor domain-containing diguanylate cyclase [Govania unica]MDA5192947.1 sensor domain-containing diguanylate cyclase [Govania unica]